MWTVKLQMSLVDKQAFANVTAVWNAGEADELSYGGRVLLDDGKGMAAFVAQAKAALALREQKSDIGSGAAAQIAAELNK